MISQVIVSEKTYTAVVVGDKKIKEALDAHSIYYSVMIRSVANMPDNCADTYDQDSKFVGRVVLYDLHAA